MPRPQDTLNVKGAYKTSFELKKVDRRSPTEAALQKAPWYSFRMSGQSPDLSA